MRTQIFFRLGIANPPKHATAHTKRSLACNYLPQRNLGHRGCTALYVTIQPESHTISSHGAKPIHRSTHVPHARPELPASRFSSRLKSPGRLLFRDDFARQPTCDHFAQVIAFSSGFDHCVAAAVMFGDGCRRLGIELIDRGIVRRSEEHTSEL